MARTNFNIRYLIKTKSTSCNLFGVKWICFSGKSNPSLNPESTLVLVKQTHILNFSSDFQKCMNLKTAEK